MAVFSDFTDPFSQVMFSLWQMLEASDEFTALVKPGNRVKFYEPPNHKDQLKAADVPEVRIVADELDPHLFRTSNGSSFKRVYRIDVYTGDYRVTAQAFPVEWAIIRSFAAIHNTLRESYPSGDPIEAVKKIKPVTGEAPGADASGRSSGWHTTLAVEVELWYRTATLQT